MTTPLTPEANKAIGTLLTLSGIEPVTNALKWLSRDGRFTESTKTPENKSLYINVPHGKNDNTDTRCLTKIIYSISNHGEYELFHSINIALRNNPDEENDFTITHETRRSGNLRALKSKGHSTGLFGDPIHFSYSDMNEIGEMLETLIKEYMLHPNDVAIFKEKLNGNLPDANIVMCEATGITFEEFHDQLNT